MPVRFCPARYVPALLAVAACGDGPVQPSPEPVHTVLVHRQDTGENLLLNSDGSDAGTYAPGVTGLTALGESPVARTLVLLHGNAIVLGSLDRPGLDTILQPAPTRMSPATISDDGRLVALVSFEPVRGLIVYDLVNATADTLDYGAVDPVLPPVFAPDGSRLALFGLTPISFTLTVVALGDPPRFSSDALAISRFLNRPIFGWPRWLDDGIHLAFLRAADAGPDTLLVGRVSPNAPAAELAEQYRAVLVPVAAGQPELELGVPSSYALAPDARALILGAFPASRATTSHAIYLVTPSAPRVQPVRVEPQQFLVAPLFVTR
jgi:hypothetical protein